MRSPTLTKRLTTTRRRSRRQGDIAGLIVAALMVAGIAFGIWAHFDGPCWMFTLKDAPLRCVVR